MSATTPGPATTAPAGWYPNQYGQSQWWDGHSWGPLAPVSAPVPASNGFAITGFVFALLVFPPALLSFFAGSAWPTYTLGLVPIILAVTFGAIGLHRAKISGAGKQLSLTAIIIAGALAVLPLYLYFQDLL